MKTDKLANFGYRLIANLLDTAILPLPVMVFFWAISYSNNLSDFTIGLVSLIVFIILPLLLIKPLLYDAWLNSNIGGTLGKILTGIEVTDENGKRLSYKKSFFRYTTGYAFSSVFFGMGYFSVITDPNKQAWHDKAAGSLVVVKRNLWIMGLIALIALFAANMFLLFSAIGNLATGPVNKDLIHLMSSVSESKSKSSGSEKQSPKQMQMILEKLQNATSEAEVQQILEEAQLEENPGLQNLENIPLDYP